VKHEVSASQYLGHRAAGHGPAKTNDILQTTLLRQILESRSEGPVANDFQENFRRPLAQALGHPDGGIGAFPSDQVAQEEQVKRWLEPLAPSQSSTLIELLLGQTRIVKGDHMVWQRWPPTIDRNNCTVARLPQ
jgi:hypothetical protein